MVESDGGRPDGGSRDEPDRPTAPPPLPSEFLAICWQRFQFRHPAWDLTRLVLVAVAVVATGALGWSVFTSRSSPPPAGRPGASTPATDGATPYGSTTTQPGAVTSTTMIAVIVVDISGAVQRPGPVRLGTSARVDEAIAAAGGATSDADLARVNRAAILGDGERVYVPRRGEETVPEPVNGGGATGAAGPTGPADLSAPGSAAAKSAIVNLNTATVDELDTLPGVGPATAQAIVEYRSEHGRFNRIEDLLDVRGIGNAKFAALRSRVTV